MIADSRPWVDEMTDAVLAQTDVLPEARLKELVASGRIMSVTRFEDHMRPDVHWIEPAEYGKAFDEIVAEENIMTTKVTIDAHAGWPVLVTTKQGEAAQEKSVHTATVEPGKTRDFYIHSGCSIIGIEEQPLPKSVPE